MKKVILVLIGIVMSAFYLSAEDAATVSTVTEKPVAAESNEAAATVPEAGAGAYTVIKGDTLWAITQNKYGDPYLWQKLWSINKEAVQNPNLIYPNQVLKIPEIDELKTAMPEETVEMAKQTSIEEQPAAQGEKEAAVEQKTAEQKTEPENTVAESTSPAPVQEVQSEAAVQETEPPKEAEQAVEPEEPAAVEEPAQEIEQEEVIQVESPKKIKIELKRGEEIEKTSRIINSKKKFTGDTFVVPLKYQFDGKIVDSKERKIMLSQSDVVFVNLGEKKGIKPGSRLYVFRRIKKVIDPTKGSVLGYQMQRVGILKVTNEVSDNVSAAVIQISFEPVQLGDLVRIADEK